MNRRANVVARVLRTRLLEHYGGHLEGPVKVVVDMEPSEHVVVALLAVLKAGAVYVPMDSHSAINRVRYMLNDLQPSCLLGDCSSVFTREADSVWSRYFVLGMEDLCQTMGEGMVPEDNLADEEMFEVTDRLSIIYTSGSTGNPKGVILSHKSAINRIQWQWDTFPSSDKERGCFKTSLMFVDSLVEIFSSVLQLVSMVIAPRGTASNPEVLVQLLETHQVSRLIMVPSMLRSLLFYLSIAGGATRLPALRLWISNSETLQPNLLEKFFQVFSCGRTFANLYGSTETMADVTYEIYESLHDIQKKCYDNNLSIGRPMSNNHVYIVTEQAGLALPGDIGEIAVSGHHVSLGYLGDASSATFRPNPFSSEPDHRVLYMSGDFARIMDGALIYEGRRDVQVKIRGQRVNITEIERVINECPFVEKSHVLYHRFSDIYSVIVAYYTTQNRRRCPRAESYLAETCRKSLPPYMRPKLLHVEEMPLQPHTGKVDRVALRKAYEKAFNRQSSRELAILDEKGRKAMNIIAINLNLPANALRRNKSFFEMGGNSISMMATIVQLKEYGLHLPIEAFSDSSTIQDIIDRVSSSEGPDAETLSTQSYEARPLNDVEQSSRLIDILADSFIEKEPLSVLLGMTKLEFMTFACSLYREASTGDLSIIILDKVTGEVVGGDFLFDFFEAPAVEHHDSMAPVFHLLQQFEVPVKERLRRSRPGPLLYNFCLCVHKALAHAEQVKVCHLIEGNVLRVAKEHGYVGVVTNNTNPVTQVMLYTSVH